MWDVWFGAAINKYPIIKAMTDEIMTNISRFFSQEHFLAYQNPFEQCFADHPPQRMQGT